MMFSGAPLNNFYREHSLYGYLQEDSREAIYEAVPHRNLGKDVQCRYIKQIPGEAPGSGSE